MTHSCESSSQSSESSLLVVGSVALDSVKTPFGEFDDILGGSATYFSVAASFFAPVKVVAVVGKDFLDDHLNIFKLHKIDTDGLEYAAGKTFRWKGEYSPDMNEAHTLDTQLNVFETFKPQLPVSYKTVGHVFLGNIDPVLQLQVLEQIEGSPIVACDTMNFWIEGKIDALKSTLSKVKILIINDQEARMLAQESNIVIAAQNIMSMGPQILIVKRGEYGVLMFTDQFTFGVPAFPLQKVVDPTGAGDSFAGGFMGHLANHRHLTDDALRQAVIFGSVMASFNVEQFSLGRLSKLTRADIDERFTRFKDLTHFESI